MHGLTPAHAAVPPPPRRDQHVVPWTSFRSSLCLWFPPPMTVCFLKSTSGRVTGACASQTPLLGLPPSSPVPVPAKASFPPGGATSRQLRVHICAPGPVEAQGFLWEEPTTPGDCVSLWCKRPGCKPMCMRGTAPAPLPPAPQEPPPRVAHPILGPLPGLPSPAPPTPLSAVPLGRTPTSTGRGSGAEYASRGRRSPSGCGQEPELGHA